MNSRELIVRWFSSQEWNRVELITLGRAVSPANVSWPNAAEHQNETFFGRLLDLLEHDVARSEAIAIVEEWARHEKDELVSATLSKLASGLSFQSGPGADFVGLISDFPIAEAAIRCPTSLISEKADRTELFSRLLSFSQTRDIVFALGGVGSGLDTFARKFADHLSGSGITVVDAADLRPAWLRGIKRARAAAAEETPSASETPTRSNEAESGRLARHANLELKCLLTCLAYATYTALRERFQEELVRGLKGRTFTTENQFADYYFSDCKSGAMYEDDRKSILRHFFEMTQRFAVMTEAPEVLVFMPWPQLAACFRDKAESDQKNLGIALWQALQEMAATPKGGSRLPYSTSTVAAPLDQYDRVCLVVCCSEVPYAHNAFLQKSLVSRYVWPLPPLTTVEIKGLIAKAIPELDESEAADEVALWTGGVPWFVRLLLSYVRANKDHLDLYGRSTRSLIVACARAVMGVLESGGENVPGPVGHFITRHREKVKLAFGESQNTDATIEEKWFGPEDEVAEGYRIEPYRLEAFVASGFIWLDGSPWEQDENNYVFRKYPVVFLEHARELPLALYRSITGKKGLRLTAY